MHPAPRPRRVPTDDEINQAAADLGIPLPVRGAMRAKLANTILLAETLPDEDTTEDTEPGFVEQIARTHADLIEAGLPATTADRVVAAIAPAVWRDTH